jgi:hypothetical protein
MTGKICSVKDVFEKLAEEMAARIDLLLRIVDRGTVSVSLWFRGCGTIGSVEVSPYRI